MNRKTNAVLFALMMFTMSLAGCFGNDGNEDGSNESPSIELTEWQVHYANSAADIPDCTSERVGWLYFISDDQNFRGCTNFGWELIEISGPAGPTGAAGADGEDGASAIINAHNSTSCPHGGTGFVIGTDLDADGSLAENEIQTTLDVCDGGVGSTGPEGPSGPAGADGANGTDGEDGSSALMTTTTVASGSNCSNGGVRIDVGIDANNNGALDADEIGQTQYVCNGAASTSTLLTNVSFFSTRACDAGGRVVEQGLDNGDGGGVPANGQLESGEIDSIVTHCSQYLVDDSNFHRIDSLPNSNPGVYWIESVGATLYFGGEDFSDYGYELHKSDGTVSGTTLVKDINPGPNSSTPSHPTELGQILYFTARDGTHGTELWKSNGTGAGTVMVADIDTGSGSSAPSNLAVMGNTLYFSADDGSNGRELWKSDGTASGTVMVKNIYSGSGSSDPTHLFAMGNTLYFRANNGLNGHELWKSDGTASGTLMLKDINPGSGSSMPKEFASMGNTLYFQADNGADGAELWKSSGTTSGTSMVKDINPNGNSNPRQLTSLGNYLYFRADDGTHGVELWKAFGISTGTVMVKNIAADYANSNPWDLTEYKGELYFKANDGIHGDALWKSNGSEQGTVLVKDIDWEHYSYGGVIGSFAIVNDRLYFHATDGNGKQLWKTDGTASGTELVYTFSPSCSGDPNSITEHNGLIFLRASQCFLGYGLWTNQWVYTEVSYS